MVVCSARKRCGCGVSDRRTGHSLESRAAHLIWISFFNILYQTQTRPWNLYFVLFAIFEHGTYCMEERGNVCERKSKMEKAKGPLPSEGPAATGSSPMGANISRRLLTLRPVQSLPSWPIQPLFLLSVLLHSSWPQPCQSPGTREVSVNKKAVSGVISTTAI